MWFEHVCTLQSAHLCGSLLKLMDHRLSCYSIGTPQRESIARAVSLIYDIPYLLAYILEYVILYIQYHIVYVRWKYKMLPVSS